MCGNLSLINDFEKYQKLLHFGNLFSMFCFNYRVEFAKLNSQYKTVNVGQVIELIIINDVLNFKYI